MNRTERRRLKKSAGKPGKASPAPDVRTTLQHAVACHQAGQWQQAEHIYRQVLKTQPRNADALHLLGLVAHQVGDHESATGLIARAIDIDPTQYSYHGNLGSVLTKQGRLDQAVASYRRALGINPDYADAHHNLGNVLMLQRKVEEAIISYRRAAAINPNYAEAYDNLGKALKDQGKLDEAVTCYHRALEIDPHSARRHNNLALALKKQGRLDDAVAACRRALEIDPVFIDAHLNLGNALREQGELENAAASYRRALKISPDHTAALNNLANAQQESGELNEAIAGYRHALKINPDDAEIHNNLGNALKAQEKLDEATAAYRRALEINPEYVEAYNNLGNALQEQGKLDEAIAFFRRALEIDPHHSETHNNLGDTLQQLGRMDEAIAGFHRALEANPENAPAHKNLGSALQQLGRMDEAVASYRRALEIDPTYAQAHRLIAGVKRHAEPDADMRAMEDLLASTDVTDEQKMHLCFGLGKAYEDLHSYAKSFECYSAANKLMRSTFSYHTAESKLYFHNLKGVFHKGLFNEYSGSGLHDNTPIFIVGMPRSGTTLVEQILASHPQVHGAGELLDLSSVISEPVQGAGDRAFPLYVPSIDRNDFSRFGAEYIRRLRRHSETATHITDKMPYNFLYWGMIKLILPEARIIHCRRDPVDTCLSCFKNYFIGVHHYAYDLTELGEYYTLYQDLMSHWHKVLPGHIFDFQYEDLIANQETQTRRLLEYCGLPWDDACLSFHKTKRPVNTASSTQVRRPIYSSSVKLWKRYEKQLAPLLRALEKGRVPHH